MDENTPAINEAEKPAKTQSVVGFVYKKPIFMVILVFIVLFLIIFFAVSVISNNQNGVSGTTPTTVPPITLFPTKETAQSSRVSPLQKTLPGKKINEKDLENKPNFLRKELLADNKTTYTFRSELPERPNIIQAVESIAVFERELTPVNPKAAGYAYLSDFKKKYGIPEISIKGSKYYGWMTITDVYASKGFTIISNPNANEVLEIHFYTPTTVDGYVQNFGSDLDPNAKPPKEGSE